MVSVEPIDVAKGFGLFALALFFLYFFLVGLSILGDSFKVIAGDSAGSLFGAVDNPIAGLMVGILATVLVQSSSTTTSIIISAAGAGVLPVQTGVPMIFGANIGTSVTNTIVSVGFVGDKEQYRRGFSGATVHDMYNYMNVLFWLPVETIISAMRGGKGGPLFELSLAIAKSFDPCAERQNPETCEKWEGPLKKITSKISKKVISVDKDVIKDFAIGPPGLSLCRVSLCSGDEGTVTCEAMKFKRKKCTTEPLAEPDTICGNEYFDAEEGENVTVSSKAQAKFDYCIVESGVLTGVDEDIVAAAQRHYDDFEINKAGAFADGGLSDAAAGWIGLVLSLVILLTCLVGLVKTLSYAVRGFAEEVLKKALNMNGYLAIVVGIGITMFVQSSSITTSILTPLVAIGTLTLEGMLPLTLGANIGTTLTGVLAALVGDSSLGFQLAMVHVFFNLFGVLMFYPIPKVRGIPIAAARKLGDLAATYKAFPIFYIFMLFLVYPGFFLAISIGFEAGGGGIAGGLIGLLFFIAAHLAFFIWFERRGGKETLIRVFGANWGEDEDDAKIAASNPMSA